MKMVSKWSLETDGRLLFVALRGVRTATLLSAAGNDTGRTLYRNTFVHSLNVTVPSEWTAIAQSV